MNNDKQQLSSPPTQSFEKTRDASNILLKTNSKQHKISNGQYCNTGIYSTAETGIMTF